MSVERVGKTVKCGGYLLLWTEEGAGCAYRSANGIWCVIRFFKKIFWIKNMFVRWL